MFRRAPPPALLVSPQRALNPVRGALLAKALTPELTSRAQALSAQLEDVSVLRRQAAAANAALFSAQSAQAERSAMIDEALKARGDQLLSDGLGGLSEADDQTRLALMWPVSGRAARRFGEPLPGGGQAHGLSIAAKKAIWCLLLQQERRNLSVRCPAGALS